ncbi:hypothetical protein [Planotetraspora kaengkrachanensis]|uniref:Uncharacterized protein n=1 Tax=Planotetraspora kaengkrachanensis TaxID=575193 RepID=A0A8J3PWU3_9ACTN|nr:hypothetical protein [Planotetraspora kaengkrachanensis]GIG82562.1 hypothetical protein Pka01_56890 [Planotetraspora kaengkrachanensis]
MPKNLLSASLGATVLGALVFGLAQAPNGSAGPNSMNTTTLSMSNHAKTAAASQVQPPRPDRGREGRHYRERFREHRVHERFREDRRMRDRFREDRPFRERERFREHRVRERFGFSEDRPFRQRDRFMERPFRERMRGGPAPGDRFAEERFSRDRFGFMDED